VGGGVALPHFSTRVTLGRDAGVIALILLRGALSLPEPPADGVPVARMFFFVPPSPRAHLDTLGRLGRAISKGSLGALLGRSAEDEELLQALAAADARRVAASRRENPT
jgi:PTS system nitrogen regulatory IIA component